MLTGSLATHRLAITALTDDPAPPPARTYFFELRDDLPKWDPGEAKAALQRVRTDLKGPGVQGAMLEFAGRKVFTRPGPIDLSHVNEIDLYMIASNETTVSVSFWNQSKCVAKTEPVTCPPAPVAFHVVEPLVWPLPEKGNCNAIAIVFEGPADRCAVISLALNDRAPSSYAGPKDEPELPFPNDGNLRMARWLTTKRTLGGKFHLTPGSDLVFAYLQPRHTRRHGVDGDLVVAVDDGDRAPLTKHFQLEGDGVDASEWHRERIPLDGFGTGRVKVSFSLSTNADSACLLSNVAVVEHTDQVRPSVLLITSDTHRGDYLGCAQSGVDVATPAIDALAARGVSFTNCYSTINNTNPSHSALMTGVHPRDTGIADMITPLLDSAPTLAEAFRAMGYRTFAAVSVEHLAHKHSGLAQGFDGFSTPYPGVERRAEETVAAAVDWLDGVGQEPVFLWVHVFDAHSPYNPPKEFDRRYYTAGRNPFDPSMPALGIPPEKLPGEFAQLRDLEFPKAQYRSEITYLDSRLAKLLDMPRFREGVTALVGDHGESLGEHGIYFDHAGLFPQTLHVPLLIAWPGCPAGTRIDSRVQQVDLGRTLLALVGGDPAALPGRDLLDALKPNAPGKTDRATTPRYMISANYTSAAIEDGESFLILVLQDPQDPHLDMQRVPHSTYFFDLAHDPECKNEVLDANMDRARALRSQLITWLEQRRSLGWAGDRLHDAKFLAQLKQIGYVTIDRAADEPLWKPDDCDWCKRFK